MDDQPINIQTLYQIFHADHEVFMATGGEQALAFCRDNLPPDLILLDVVMPGMDGIEVCRRLKSNPALADIPVIFVTARSEPADEVAALAAGGVDFIAKPVNPVVVRARQNPSHTQGADRFAALHGFYRWPDWRCQSPPL